MMPASKPSTGPKKVTVAHLLWTNGVLKIDGIVICRTVKRVDGVHLQFIDRDRMRSVCRGTEVVEIPLAALIQFLGGAQ